MSSAEPDIRLIDGRFELLRRLGGGGMGLVWLARDNALDREVALKEVRLPEQMAADPAVEEQMRLRVLREARALARLQNPHVVVIHHIVDSPEHPYPWLVMELVSGGSLADRLARGPLAVPEAVRIGRGVLGALRAAHTAGIEHRDVKPGNVLLRSDGTPVLTDFGIATLHGATALTMTGALIGSPEYMAPERIRGARGGPASDLWSLGMMLYVAVEGRHPLRRESTIATLAAVLDEPLPAPVHAGPLAPVLSAVLGKDPAGRPDAEQLDRMLEAVAAQAPAGRDTSADPGAVAPVGPGSAYPSPGSAYPAYPSPGYVAPPPQAMGHASSWTPGAPGPAPHAFGPHTPPPGLPGPAHAVQQGDDRSARVHRTSGRDSRARRKRTRLVFAVALAAVTTAATAALTMLPRSNSHDAAHADGTFGTPATASRPASTGSATATAVPPTSTAVRKAAGRAGDLLTPAGVRQVVKAMRPRMSHDKVKELVVRTDYATAEAPTPEDPGLSDNLTYRDGRLEHTPGGVMESDARTVNLDLFDWDVLPGLLTRAQNTLKVPHPTDRYIIVDPPDAFNSVPTIRVYLSDAYGGAYLTADPHGKVVNTYPRGG